MMYWDGKKLHVIECKGGSSELMPSYTAAELSAWQTTRSYLERKSEQMEQKLDKPEVRAAGELLSSQLSRNRVQSHVATFKPTKKQWEAISPPSESSDLDRLAMSHELSDCEFNSPPLKPVETAEGSNVFEHDLGKRPDWGHRKNLTPIEVKVRFD